MYSALTNDRQLQSSVDRKERAARYSRAFVVTPMSLLETGAADADAKLIARNAARRVAQADKHWVTNGSIRAAVP